jgi:hypothetical protein
MAQGAPPRQKDLNSAIMYVGCDNNGANCLQGTMESIDWWGRPAPAKIIADDPTHLITADFSGPSYLGAKGIVPFTCPVGVSTANCWNVMSTSLSGSLYDSINGVALTATGTPRYQAFSGLLARGRGRRGTYFLGSSSQYIAGAASATASIGANTSAVVYVSGSFDPAAAATMELVGSTVSSATAGYGIWTTNNPRLYCAISDGTNARICYGTITSGWARRHLACRHSKAASWADPVPYQDGVALSATCAGTNPSGSAANGAAVKLGTIGTNYLTGQIVEAYLSAGGTYTDATVLAHYKQKIQTGDYWTDDANTVAHYKFTEPTMTNGVGLRDHSGNGNHLTVVSGTPTPQYSDAPWPAGTGLTMPAVEVSDTAYFATAAAQMVPAAGQPFSAIDRKSVV